MSNWEQEEDPVIERLDEALSDARVKLNEVLRSGRVEDAEAIRMLVEVRQDIVFAERQRKIEMRKAHEAIMEVGKKVEDLDAKKVDKNPNMVWFYRLVIGGVVTSILALIVWLVEGGLAAS